ncbi:hypothetical protein [Bradyrhizobium elkanii]|uniref:hypothetical protein n=1 Tax=Bradyrhizobium elkanii TaxID=29448 RepID=UPI0004B32322|nr:hypothetical protein [Bradyrhizobium elkanii]WLA83207.1 hypothetical protein QNJ99_02365 [Bradyrhizobium elkanii]
MSDARKYTIYVPNEIIGKDDVVVARNLSGPDAIKTALEHSGSWTALLHEDDYGSFRLYRLSPLAKKWPHDKRRLDTLCATVVKTADRARDEAFAMSMIVDQFVRRSRHYWKGWVETDDEFDERLLRAAKRRQVRRIDREIATKLVDALLADGYVVTDALSGEFEYCTDRKKILAYLFEVDMLELIVEKNDQEFWIRLIFGESGWDLIQDYTVDLAYLIDPIVEPYLPWNQPKPDMDGAIRVPVLKSPEDVVKIEEILK